MTQATPSKAVMPARSNVYTVLAAVGALALLAAIVFVAIKNADLTQQGNPFAVVESSQIPIQR